MAFKILKPFWFAAVVVAMMMAACAATLFFIFVQLVDLDMNMRMTRNDMSRW